MGRLGVLGFGNPVLPSPLFCAGIAFGADFNKKDFVVALKMFSVANSILLSKSQGKCVHGPL